MIYRAAADLVLVIHLLFILFVLFGGLLGIKNKAWAILHLPAVAWAVFLEFTGRLCPLTPLENWLRNLGGLDTYREGFIPHYLIPIIYPAGLTATGQQVLGAILIGANLLIYLYLWRRPKS